jgi:ABC-type transporter Mla MlaB component
MFRIDIQRTTTGRTDVRLSGRLAEYEAAEVSSAVAEALQGAGPVHLELSGLTGVDRYGVALLTRLVKLGHVRLSRCPSFLTLWLRAENLSRIRYISRVHES